MHDDKLMFVYGEPALVVSAEGRRHVVVGDLHIGIERKLSGRGIHVFGATDRMAVRILGIAKEFGAEAVIVIGDVKDSILYPDSADRRLIRSFFDGLSGLDVRVIAGNHDAHLGEIVDVRIEREARIGEFAFMHGDKNPSEGALQSDYIVTAHNHAMLRMRDENGALYEERVWLVAGINRSKAKRDGISFNKGVKFIAMPAFNELVSGSPIGKGEGGVLSPAMRSGLFNYRSAAVYNLRGEPMDRRRGLVLTYNDF